MRVTRHSEVAAFRRLVEPLLLADEGRSNLLLGLLRQLESAAFTPAAPLLLAVEEEDGRVVAAALQTPPFCLVLSPAPEAALDALVDHVIAHGLPVPGFVGPTPSSHRCIQRLSAQRGCTPRLHMPLRFFECRTLVPPRPPVGGGAARVAGADDLDRLVGWCAAFDSESGTSTPLPRGIIEARLQAGEFLLWETDQAVAMAAVVRRTDTAASIGFVYTPPALRGRGYGSCVTHALTARVFQAGLRCYLFTDERNPTSNRIYQDLGYEEQARFEEWRLD